MTRFPFGPAAMATLALGLSAQDDAGAGAVAAELAPHAGFVTRYCRDCHGGDLVRAELDLTATQSDPVERLFRLSRLRERVRAGEMPPPDADAPPPAERDAFVAWVDGELRREVPALPPASGRVTVRRLNSAQWRRTVHDLFGVEVATAGFPADDLGYGFDTVGDAMTFSTLHLEKYLAAAGEVAALVFAGEDPEHPAVRRFEGEAMRVARGGGVDQDGDLAVLTTRALLEQTVELPRDGTYRLRIVAGASQAGDEVAKMLVRWDDGDLEVLEVGSRELAEFELERTLTRGVHRLGVAFVNDYYDPKFPDPKRRDRNLYVDAVAVIGPLDVRPVPVAQRWVHDAVPSRGSDGSRLRAFAGALLPTLWRRPVAVSEARRHAAVGEAMLAAGEDFTAALRAVLQAALTSPNFLFRCENSTPGLALASRLSFFLWASAPDARLLRLAKAGKLGDRERLRAETRRLLADPRADSLATEFAAQWLELRNLAEFTPDPERFPEFDEALRRSLRSETELLFRAVQREDRDVRELLDCDFTFVDARLAGFYGLPRPDDAADDAAFERVELPAELRFRGGALGHGSILALTSNPTRTSPVKRGKWILENLLGAPPPPPPPGAGALANEQAVDSSKSFREQLAMHREDSKCAVCHVRMDALGLALERFDAIGHFRERDKDGVIDCSGELPGGAVVDGLVGLKHVLAADPAFVRTLALKLFVYGVGRAPRPIDRLVLDHEVDALLATGKVTIADLVLTIVDSAAFRVVGGEGEGAGDAGR